MIYFKSYNTEKGHIVAMCDEELIGKVLEEGPLVIDIKTYANFYKGELLDEKAAANKLSSMEIYSANIVGEEAVRIIKGKEAINDSDIKKIKGVPFVHLYKIDY